MIQLTKCKAPIFAFITSAVFVAAAAGCKAGPERPKTQAATPSLSQTSKLAPIRKALSCLPDEAALIAAHRATDKRWTDQAENSLTGLKALISHGTLMAEMDVAGLKDDTLIAFHDGVWDDISTGRGPVAASTKSDLERILLKSRRGDLTAERPSLFTDMLQTAKGHMYLEIDFKSSADPADVINAIRQADMTDQVLLIAYNADQARALKRLAPEMLRSNPTDATETNHAVWLGYNVGRDNTAAQLRNEGNFIIGRIGDPNRQPPFRVLRRAADILVTDHAQRYDGIIGLEGQAKAEYEACIAK